MMKKQKPVLPHYNMLYMRSFICIPLLLRYCLTFPKRVFETLWRCLLPKCGFIIFLEFWNVDLQNGADFLFDCQKWGLDLTQPDAPNPATTKYTDFLLRTASECVDSIRHKRWRIVESDRIKCGTAAAQVCKNNNSHDTLHALVCVPWTRTGKTYRDGMQTSIPGMD